MKWDMKKPCGNCPFKRRGHIPLHPERVQEIAGMMLDSQGGVFPCHKTTQLDDDGEPIGREGQVHCAGALCFAEKHGTSTQMMRIAGRLGMYDPTPLERWSVQVEVFDTLDEMQDAHAESNAALTGRTRRKRAARKA